MSERFRTIVVEDEPYILAYLARRIESLDERFEVIAKARHGAEALELATQMRPDVVFSDVYMPRMDGIALSKALRELPNPPVVAIVSGFRDFDYAREAMRNGVQNYLLKPISDDELRGVLGEIGARLALSHATSDSEIIWRAVLVSLSAEEVPPRFARSKFYPFLLNLGALATSIFGIEHEQALSRQLNALSAAQIAACCGLDEHKVWFCRANSYAQRLIVLESNETVPDAEAIFAHLQKRISAFPVNLCTNATPCGLGELHARQLELNSLLNRRLSPGNSALIRADEPLPPVCTVLGREIINAFCGFLRIGKHDQARALLSQALEQWQEKCCPQYQIHSELSALIQACASLSNATESENIYLAEYYAPAAICAVPRLYDALEQIWNTLDDLLFHHNAHSDYSQKTADDIVNYLNAHYADDITVESIADILGFNVIYLNRIFKKHQQIPILQYLINLRIEKAKHMMLEHPDLPVAIIGINVGYNDPHYFSRAFKKITGLPPTEWRTEHGI